ncbi:MAG: hypothetical protein U0840_23245 [Gemmataceae bacterium]
MRHTFVVGSALAMALVLTTVNAAEDLKSGAQKPSMKIKAFNPLHCSGSGEGTKGCLV